MQNARRTQAAVAIVLGVALAATRSAPVSIRANPAVTVVTITSTTGNGTGLAALQNTTPSTTYSVLRRLRRDLRSDADVQRRGGNPVAISPATMRNVQVTCPARGVPAMRRCVYHATNNTNGTALADFMTACAVRLVEHADAAADHARLRLRRRRR